MAWPPTLDEFKLDRGVDDTLKDAQYQQVLDAAVAFVEEAHAGRFNFDADPLSDRPEPSAAIVLGTLRLAGRWHTRRRSPDGMLEMAELGSSEVARTDPDIARLLRLGRHAPKAVG